MFSHLVLRKMLELSDTQVMKAPFKNAFWDMMHHSHEVWNVLHFLGVVKRNPLLDEETRMVYGGPNGVRLFIVTCLRIFWAVFFAEPTQRPQLSISRAMAPAFILD